MPLHFRVSHILNVSFLLSVGGFAFAWSTAREVYTLFVFDEYIGTAFWTLAMLLSFAAFGVFYLGYNRQSSEKEIPIVANWICAGTGSIGIALLCVMYALPIPHEVTMLLGVFCVCGSCAGLIRLWGEQNCSIDIVNIVARVSAALLLVALLEMAVSSLPMSARVVLCVSSYFVSAGCLSVRWKVAEPVKTMAEPSRFLPTRWSWMLYSGVALVLFACGLIWSIIPTVGSEAWAMGTFIGATLLVLSTLWVTKRFHLNFLPVASLTIVQICILIILSGWLNEIFFLTVIWFGHSLLWIWVFSVSCWQGSLEPNAPGRLVARGMLLLSVSNLIGEVVGRFAHAQATTILIVSAVVLAVAAELIFGSAHLFDPPIDTGSRDEGEKPAHVRFSTVAQVYEFTPREFDVFLLLRKGYSVKRTAEELFVSENTVKTHIRSLYSKLDVHTRQGLIDLSEQIVAVDSLQSEG